MVSKALVQEISQLEADFCQLSPTRPAFLFYMRWHFPPQRN